MDLRKTESEHGEISRQASGCPCPFLEVTCMHNLPKIKYLSRDIDRILSLLSDSIEGSGCEIERTYTSL